MKGRKGYELAILIHKKMYNLPSVLDKSEKRKLYNEYLALIRKSAYLGYKEALFDLGQQYEKISFLGVDNPMYSPKKCVYWYSKACDKGHAEACNNLAALYEEGIGCEMNLQKAVELYKLSADLGSINGRGNYRIMLKNISKGGIYYNKL